MLKCVKVDRVPDDIMVTYIKYHTLAGLKMKMYIEFEEDVDGLEEGQIYMVAKVPDDCSDDISFEDLASAGVDIIAYCYEPEPGINHRGNTAKGSKRGKGAKRLDEEYYSKNNK